MDDRAECVEDVDDDGNEDHALPANIASMKDHFPCEEETCCAVLHRSDTFQFHHLSAPTCQQHVEGPVCIFSTPLLLRWWCPQCCDPSSGPIPPAVFSEKRQTLFYLNQSVLLYFTLSPARLRVSTKDISTPPKSFKTTVNYLSDSLPISSFFIAELSSVNGTGCWAIQTKPNIQSSSVNMQPNISCQFVTRAGEFFGSKRSGKRPW